MILPLVQRPYFPPVGVAAWGLLRSTGIPGGEQERGDLGDELEAVGVRLPLRRHRDSGEGQGELNHDGWVATTRTLYWPIIHPPFDWLRNCVTLSYLIISLF